MQAGGPGARFLLARADFPKLLSSLRGAGYAIVGPTVRDGAIVYGPIDTESDLPIGWTEKQEAGRYRLERRPDEALFGYNLGPQSWKKFLFPPRERLFTVTRAGDSFEVTPEPAPERPFAFLGMRACELAAVDIQDQVFTEGVVDAGYRARRNDLLRVAVQCGQAAPTCFCVSMGTGPGVTKNFDLALTELIRPGAHEFLVVVGSDAGAAVLSGLPLRSASDESVREADAVVDRTASSMHRRMETGGIRDLLVLQPDHPRWQIVAQRCLSCTNCTLACPTCFCHSTEEVPSLDAEKAERWRRWDSCFTLGFSEVHGTPIRKSGSARYRQWLTHKLATWQDQFGRSGCVGCGRCITWCPVGIDLTEEVAAIRASPTPPTRSP